eukprot:PhM_4_TR11970/c0_g2_i1/m.83903
MLSRTSSVFARKSIAETLPLTNAVRTMMTPDALAKVTQKRPVNHLIPSGYHLFMSEKMKEFYKQHGHTKGSTRELPKQWGNLSATERERYTAQANKNKELRAVILAENKTRFASPYALFVKERYLKILEQLRRENPDGNKKEMTGAALKQTAQEWRALDEATKQKYLDIAREQRTKFRVDSIHRFVADKLGDKK